MLSNYDMFMQMIPVLRDAIVNELDGMCNYAIARKLMTFPEKAAIMAGDNKYSKASCLLEHFASRIKVNPPVLEVFKEMLKKHGAAEVLQKMGRCFGCIVGQYHAYIVDMYFFFSKQLLGGPQACEISAYHPILLIDEIHRRL